MQLGNSTSLVSGVVKLPTIPSRFSFSVDGSEALLAVADTPSDTQAIPVISSFVVDGIDRVASLDDAPEIATDIAPGAKNAGNVITQAVVDGLQSGDVVLFRYRITALGGNPFIPNPSPFTQDVNPLPSSLGWHAVLLTVRDDWVPNTGTVNAVNNAADSTTYESASLRRVSWRFDLTAVPVGARVEWSLSFGTDIWSGSSVKPNGDTYYVDPAGSDKKGTGARAAPFKTPERAQRGCQPGDTIILRKGTYRPFEVTVSGVAGNPITITTLPEERHQARIVGNLAFHSVYGGFGVTPANDNFDTRDGIRVSGRNHVVIRDLYIGYVWRNGIFIIGAGENTVTGNHLIENCVFEYSGLSAINIAGERSDMQVPVGDAYRTRNVDVIGCDVSRTNVVTDYNNNTMNSNGEPGGVGEAITIANSVQSVRILGCYIHDTRQYGVDAKNHVADIEIDGNLFEDVDRYAGYCDAGEQDVRRVRFTRNRVLRCRHGFVCAREEDGNDAGNELVLEDITIEDNWFIDTERSWFLLQKHPTKDTENKGLYRRIYARRNRSYNSNLGRIFAEVSIDELVAFGSNSDGVSVVSDIVFEDNISWNPGRSHTNRTDVLSDPRFTFTGNINCDPGSAEGVDPGYANPGRGDLSLAA
ncbi:MAG: right-handed parallel beta-helix repeat-containing protein [Pseudomonadota bacterium]